MNPWRSQRRRFGWIDALVLSALASFVAFAGYRIQHQLHYNWEWTYLLNYIVRWDNETGEWKRNILLEGLFSTIRLSIWSLVLGSMIGLVVGVLRTSNRLYFVLMSRAYVDLVRNTPSLVFLFVFYFFVASQFLPFLNIPAWTKTASPEMRWAITFLFGPPNLLESTLSGILCLALYEGAYAAEIVRAGIEAVPRAQHEAGLSIGLTRRQIMTNVVLPQALYSVIPPLVNQIILLIRGSSLLSLIGVAELTLAASEVSITQNKLFEVWLFIACVYFTICASISAFLGRIEERMSARR